MVEKGHDRATTPQSAASIYERNLVSRLLTAEHRRLIGLFHLSNDRLQVVAILVAQKSRRRAFRPANAGAIEANLLRAGFRTWEVVTFTRSAAGRQVATTWPALALEVLAPHTLREVAAVPTSRRLIELEEHAAHVIREATATINARRFAAHTPGRPAPEIREESVPNRPVGWSTSSYFTGGE